MASTALATALALLAAMTMSLAITSISAAAVGDPDATSSAAAAAAFYNDLGGFGSGGGGGGVGLGSVGSAAAGDFGDTGFAEGFPPDPSKFKTPEELKDYLERLQLYYALVGRPRFGKRSSGYRRHRSLQGLPSRGDRIYGYAVFF